MQNSKIWLVCGTVFFSEHIGWLLFVRDSNNHIAILSEKDACCNFYYNYIQYENVKKLYHDLTQKNNLIWFVCSWTLLDNDTA